MSWGDYLCASGGAKLRKMLRNPGLRLVETGVAVASSAGNRADSHTGGPLILGHRGGVDGGRASRDLSVLGKDA